MTGEPPVVGVVGTGVIGAAWCALFLARGLQVRAYDPAPEAERRLRQSIREAWPTVGESPEPPWEALRWSADVAGSVQDAVHVQESGPERLEVKHPLIAEIDAHAPATAVIASSSSGLRPTDVQAPCTHHPERVLVGHPFHPAHLIPLVEVVGGEQTAPEAITNALAFYTGLGKRPVHVRQELDGHLANRLQAALWREAYSLVARGAATVTDIDAAITNGPGLRWAVVGPFAGQHLSGGDAGIAHTLQHLGPPMAAWWDDLGTPALTPDLVDRVVAQTNDEMGGLTSQDLSAVRDVLVLRIIAAKTAEPGLAT